jgi:lactoylglutathione lyase
MIRQLAHVCIHTNNLEAMIDFYSGKLGLKIKFSLKEDDETPVGHYFEVGNSTFIEIFDQDRVIKKFGGEKHPLTAPLQRFQHMCFEVTDIESMKKRLESAGVPFLDLGTGLDHSRQCWIGDPDGNAIELMEYTGKSSQLTGE